MTIKKAGITINSTTPESNNRIALWHIQKGDNGMMLSCSDPTNVVLLHIDKKQALQIIDHLCNEFKIPNLPNAFEAGRANVLQEGRAYAYTLKYETFNDWLNTEHKDLI